MDVELRLAVDEATLAAVWRLRYEVFVRERKGKLPEADHVQCRLTDRLEATSTVMAAVDRATGAVVGTVRTNTLSRGTLSLYPAVYRIPDISPAQEVSTSFTTYLAVAATHRRKGISVRLVKALYAHGMDQGVRFDFLDCPTPLVPYFVRLGYRWQRALDHPWFGPSHLMRLSLFDSEHLTSVHSPLCTVGRSEAHPPQG